MEFELYNPDPYSRYYIQIEQAKQILNDSFKDQYLNHSMLLRDLCKQLIESKHAIRRAGGFVDPKDNLITWFDQNYPYRFTVFSHGQPIQIRCSEEQAKEEVQKDPTNREYR